MTIFRVSGVNEYAECMLQAVILIDSVIGDQCTNHVIIAIPNEKTSAPHKYQTTSTPFLESNPLSSNVVRAELVLVLPPKPFFPQLSRNLQPIAHSTLSDIISMIEHLIRRESGHRIVLVSPGIEQVGMPREVNIEGGD